MAKKAKKVSALIKLQIQAGKANPAPPIGPALGQHGLNIMDFCKAYNEATKDQMGNVIPVVITVYEDKSFSFELKTPPVSKMILEQLKIKKGSSNPNTKFVGVLTAPMIEEIVEKKIKGLNARTKEAAAKIIKGSARSMGVKVRS